MGTVFSCFLVGTSSLLSLPVKRGIVSGIIC